MNPRTLQYHVTTYPYTALRVCTFYGPLLDCCPPPLTQEISEALTQAAKPAAATNTATTNPAHRGTASAVTTAKRLRTGPIRSEAVVVRGMVFISGQTAFPPPEQETKGHDTRHQDERGDRQQRSEKAEEEKGEGEKTKGDVEKQATQALEKIRILLEEAGSSVAKVVTVTFYVMNCMGRDDFSEGIDAAWGRWVVKGSVPARTVVVQPTSGDAVGAVGEAQVMKGTGQEVVRVEVQATAYL